MTECCSAGPAPIPGVRLRLLGRFAVESPPGVPLAMTRRAGDLLAYLALQPTTSHHRDVVAEALWPDCQRDNSRKYLRRSLWLARRALSPLAANGDVVEVDGPYLRLSRGAHLWVDLSELDKAYDLVADADRSGACAEHLLAATRSAVECYRGDVLEGWDDEWCLVARERYRSVYISVLEWVVDRCVIEARPLLAQRFCRLLLDLDPAHEWAHRVMMQLNWDAGDRTRALRQFATCEVALTRELGVQPAQATIWLYRSIRDDQPQVPSAGAPAPRQGLPVRQ